MYYSPTNQKISTSDSVNLSILLVDEENYTRAEPKSVHNSSENTSLTGNMFSYISEKLSQFQFSKSYSISFIQSCYVSKLWFRDESTRRLWALHIYVVPITYWAAYEWLLCILLQQYCKTRSYWADSLGGIVFLQL